MLFTGNWHLSNGSRFRASCRAGFLWRLLGFQRRGRTGRATQEDHGRPGAPQSAESAGLFNNVGEPRLRRWLHEQGLQVRHPERRHRRRRCLPLHSQGRAPAAVADDSLRGQTLDSHVFATSLLRPAHAGTATTLGQRTAPPTVSCPRGTRTC